MTFNLQSAMLGSREEITKELGLKKEPIIMPIHNLNVSLKAIFDDLEEKYSDEVVLFRSGHTFSKRSIKWNLAQSSNTPDFLSPEFM